MDTPDGVPPACTGARFGTLTSGGDRLDVQDITTADSSAP
jgi:hypothetical protein